MHRCHRRDACPRFLAQRRCSGEHVPRAGSKENERWHVAQWLADQAGAYFQYVLVPGKDEKLQNALSQFYDPRGCEHIIKRFVIRPEASGPGDPGRPLSAPEILDLIDPPPQARKKALTEREYAKVKSTAGLVCDFGNIKVVVERNAEGHFKRDAKGHVKLVPARVIPRRINVGGRPSGSRSRRGQHKTSTLLKQIDETLCLIDEKAVQLANVRAACAEIVGPQDAEAWRARYRRWKKNPSVISRLAAWDRNPGKL
jgi:hypothetical protein